MDALQAILLGLLQGIAEWLPVSSKSQVMLAAMAFLGMEPGRALSLGLYLHIGTMLAAIVYFRKTIVGILVELKGGKLGRVARFLLISVAATGVVGLPLFLLIRGSFLSAQGEVFVGLIGIGLIATGVLLLKSKERGSREKSQATSLDALVAGAAQGFSVLPGVSRSGVTLAPLLWLGFSQEAALKLSFLMSILAVSGAEVGFCIMDGFRGIGASEGCLLVLSSFLFGILSMEALMRFSRRVDFSLFCISLGLLSLLPILFLFLR